jgi:hypothetical protein
MTMNITIPLKRRYISTRTPDDKYQNKVTIKTNILTNNVTAVRPKYLNKFTPTEA